MTLFPIGGVVYGFTTEAQLTAYWAARTPAERAALLATLYRVPAV